MDDSIYIGKLIQVKENETGKSTIEQKWHNCEGAVESR